MITRKILLTLSLCQLVQGPVMAQQLEGNSDSITKAQEECSKKEFYQWNDSKKRCEPKQDTYNLRVDYQECEKKESEQERKSCMEALASKETEKLDLQKAEKGGMSKGLIHGAFAGLGAINLVSTSGKASNCMSSMVLAGTGVAGIAAELYFKKYAKDQMEDLKKGFKEETESDPYATQIKSFEYLKKEQETVAKIAGMRKKGYYLLTAGYGVATAMAAWDLATKNYVCKNDEAQSSTDSNQGQQGQQGQDSGKAEPDAGAAATMASLKGMMLHPGGVAAMAGIATAYTFTLASAAGKQEKESKKNAEEIEKIKQKLMTTLAGFCPTGHDDMKNTRCYCYNTDNSKNESHSKSETCQMLWAKDDNLFKNTSDKAATAKLTAKGCVFSDGKFDENCSCKKYRNAKGNNACMKSNVGTITAGAGLPNLNTMDYQKTLNSIYSGNTSIADLDGGELAKNAAIASKLSDQAIKKINAHKNTKSPIVINDKVLKNFADKYGKLAPKGNSFSTGSDLAAGQRAAIGGAIAESIEKAEEKVASASPTYTKTQGLANKQENTEDLNFSFDDSSSGSSANVEEFAQKNYDYRQNDIHTRQDVSIWQVISNRYMQTGLKRLFPDEIKQ